MRTKIIDMKKQVLLLFSLTICASAQAQVLPIAEASEDYQEIEPRNGVFFHRPESSSQTVIWSEDFANGIPTTWSQNGTPALALWEYRGPNTAPPDSVGSRGCWAGPNQSGNLGAPINSPTRSNGFVIFDSDYLHSNGDRATNGQGTVPAPHVGRLRTDTIDLTNYAGAELGFYMYARRFQSAWYIAISIDGGASFPDTVEAFPTTELAVNQSTDQNAYYRANLSNVVANEPNVVLEFVFDGNVSNSNGSGRYYWMIDDIELVTPPENLLLFTPATAPGTSGVAPAQDILFNNDGSYPKYMHLRNNEIVPITFDANVYNYGTQTQTNVGLAVEIIDEATGSVVSTVYSPTEASLSSFDTAYYTTLTTTAWTPQSDGEYLVIYKAISDSISIATTSAADTFSLAVGDEYAIDDGRASNYFGTNTGTNGMIAIGVLYHFDDQSNNGRSYLQGIEMQMSCLTDSTADMEIAIYDTAGFVFNTGFPNNAQAIYRQVYTFDGSIPCNLVNFSFEDANGDPLDIANGSYYVIANLFPNATNGVIRFANSANWNQPSYASVFQNQTGSWFSGFSNSSTFEAPHMRVIRGYTSGLVETSLADFTVFPNPNNGSFNVEVQEGGSYEIQIRNLAGQLMLEQQLDLVAGEKAQLDLSLPDGLYLLELIHEDGARGSRKVTIKN